MFTEPPDPPSTRSEQIINTCGVKMHSKPDSSGDQSMMDMEYSVTAVESIIMYTFQNKKLLEQALTHPTYSDGPSYQRLEFLGDSALGLAISSFFYLTYPDIDAGKLSDLRAANISSERLARVAVHHGLHMYIRHGKLSDKIIHHALLLKPKTFDVQFCYAEFGSFFIKVEEEEQMAVYGGQMTAPKVLADIVESMAAAVYIDCGFNIQMMWSIFKNLLEPLVTLDDILAQPQPITALHGACRKDGKRVAIRYSKNGGRNIASVFVDDTFIASGSPDSPKNAKLHAAEAALLKIPKSRSGDDLDFNELMEIEGAKPKLLELSNKKKWPKPTYRVEQELGRGHDKRYVSSVQMEVCGTVLSVKGSERSRVKDAENSAASLMFCVLREAGYT